MDFKVFYNQDALNDLEKIKSKVKRDCEVIVKKIEGILTNNPFPFGKTIKKLKNIQPPLYRLRINASVSYRVFYRLIGNSVYILKIVQKKEADRVLRKF